MKRFLRILQSDGTSNSQKPLEMLRRETNFKLGKTHFFRALTGEEHEVLSVLDCRNFESEPNNKLLVLCEHASNDIKGFKLR